MRYNLEIDGELVAQFVKRADAERMAFELSHMGGEQWVITDKEMKFSRTVIRRGSFEEFGATS